MFDELSETDVASAYGYNVSSENDHPQMLSILGYADDTVLIGNSISSATSLLMMAENKFKEIGLKINPSKSCAININLGTLSSADIITNSNQKIKSIGKNDKIKYLGVSYSDSLILDQDAILKRLGNSLETLSKSSLLNCDQKLNILNEYISPTLVYPLQTAPLKKSQLLSRKYWQTN